MSFLWIYEIAAWQSFILIVGFTVSLSIVGIYIFRPWVKKWWEGHDNNDQISFYLSAIGVFYGITLGLLAAGVWQNFNEAEEKVNLEASTLSALFIDVSSFPVKESQVLKTDLKKYVHFVIHKAWDLHRQGISKTQGTELLFQFQKHLYGFNPQGPREEIIFAESVKEFNRLIELRRQRLQSVTSGMNASIWVVIAIGAFFTLIICCLFNIKSLRLHVIMNGIIGIIIGTLIHLVVMYDNPFRGDVSIDSEAFEGVYEDLMQND
jgi:hypothetical protein